MITRKSVGSEMGEFGGGRDGGERWEELEERGRQPSNCCLTSVTPQGLACKNLFSISISIDF